MGSVLISDFGVGGGMEEGVGEALHASNLFSRVASLGSLAVRR
jgi:hypothetical protein